MNITPLQDSFNRGELTPKVYRRVETEYYLDGVSLMTNFTSAPRGAARRRFGFRFLGRVALPDTTINAFPQTVNLSVSTPSVDVVVG